MKFFQILFLSGVILLLTTTMPFSVAAAPEALKFEKLNILFTERAFLGANPLDVEAALKVFVKSLGFKYGYNIQTTMRRFKNSDEFTEHLSIVKPDLIIADSWTYLMMESAMHLEPLFICSNHGEYASRYLLMVRPEGPKELTGLRGKSLNLLATANANLGVYWLTALLEEAELGQPESFFDDLRYQTDPMPAILQVFFAKKDAALIDSSKFELMAELNPQLRHLRTVASSEPLVNAVICLKQAGWPSDNFRQDLIEALNGLHLDPAGRQILTMFKVQELKPFKPYHLNTVRQLREKILLKNPPTKLPQPLARYLQ